ncbi:MAG: energy-coupling factor ABC transporter ATP-binding protein [Coriobacteriia bacterium]|nr:energy-coupling factor ABC transporter ATP-binding protein [Coriobacteriia bacterium]
MSHHIIELKDVGFSYPDGTHALSGISLRILHGESVAVIGANGAGKSTLLMHLNGLHTASEGSVRIGDAPVVKSTLEDIRKTVGTVFQDPDDQLFMPLVSDDVAFGPLNLGLPPAEVERRVDSALAEVDARGLKERFSHQLSGGEKRRVAIATVLAMLPSILVLDEPSSGLDPKARRRLIELLKGFEHTKIIATHDLDLAADVCERTIVLSHGSVAADRPTAEVFCDTGLLERCGLEPPLGMQGCPVCATGITGDKGGREDDPA